jgi:hypothetical protein
LARLAAVNAIALVLLPTAPGFATQVVMTAAGIPEALVERFECSSALALLFAPPAVGSSLDRSPEVCQSNASLTEVLPAGWSAEAATPADVFAAADPHTRRLVAVLYGGRRPLVARGWIATVETLASITLISPRPDPVNRRLLPGTLLIRVVTKR